MNTYLICSEFLKCSDWGVHASVENHALFNIHLLGHLTLALWELVYTFITPSELTAILHESWLSACEFYPVQSLSLLCRKRSYFCSIYQFISIFLICKWICWHLLWTGCTTLPMSKGNSESFACYEYYIDEETHLTNWETSKQKAVRSSSFSNYSPVSKAGMTKFAVFCCDRLLDLKFLLEWPHWDGTVRI